MTKAVDVPSQRRLPYPVIIPQRRPRNKGRGFIRAYAPALNDCGIDQDTFLSFLKSFHSASKASPVFDIIMVSAAIAGFVPHFAATIASTVAQIAVGTAKELQVRHRTNTFLDQMNATLFEPKGLYCLIMTYNPDAPSASSKSSEDGVISSEQLNITGNIAKYHDQRTGKLQKLKRNARVSNGLTCGEMELPQSAPLIFPNLGFGPPTRTCEQGQAKSNALKNTNKFFADYFDRRAQAIYVRDNPDSMLSVPVPKFASRYSDPNHAASSGNPLSFLSGGYINNQEQNRQQREAQREQNRQQQVENPQRQQSGGFMRRDILYLMIVNMPTQAELAEARLRMHDLVKRSN